MELLSNMMNSNKTAVEYDAGQLQILKIGNDNAFQECDKIYFLPYLIQDNAVLLKYDPVLAWNVVRPEIDRYLHVPYVNVKAGEDMVDVLKTALTEQFNLELSDNFDVKIGTGFFNSPSSTSRSFMCILQLMDYDYSYGMGQIKQDKNNAKIYAHDVKNIITYDMMSHYMIDILKKNFLLNF